MSRDLRLASLNRDLITLEKELSKKKKKKQRTNISKRKPKVCNTQFLFSGTMLLKKEILKPDFDNQNIF